jgi:hypothetical protein
MLSARLADYETVIRDLLSSQYKNPVWIVSFNTAEGWSRDVSAEIAEELRQRCEMVRRKLPASIRAIPGQGVVGALADYVLEHARCLMPMSLYESQVGVV